MGTEGSGVCEGSCPTKRLINLGRTEGASDIEGQR